MAGRFRKRGNIPTSYHQNQFVSTFDPLTRRRSLTDLSDDQPTHESRHSGARHSYHGQAGTARSHRNTSSSNAMTVNFKSSSLFTDKESRSILKQLEGQHKEPMKAKKLIYEQGEKLKRMTKDKLVLAEESLTYQTLLEELFFDDESLIIDRGLHYTYLEFKDEKMDNFLKPTMSEGRAFLSNCRLLLVTCEQLKGATLSKVSTPAQGDHYQVAAYLNEEYHYQFLPLTCIKGIELHTRNGGQAEVQISSNPPICDPGGMCGWFGNLFGGSCVKETWEPLSGPTGAEYTERILIISVTMPPWMTPTNIKIHVSPDVELKVFTHFVSLMQRFAPDIASSLNIMGEVKTERTPGAGEEEYSELPHEQAAAIGVSVPAINVEKIKHHQSRRQVKAPKVIRQPSMGFPYGLLPASNMVNPVYYDPKSQRVYGDFAEYDLQSIHHAMQRIPQVQLETVEPTIQLSQRSNVKRQSRIASQVSVEEKVEELMKKRDSMAGRELPVPVPGSVLGKEEVEYDKADGRRIINQPHHSEDSEEDDDEKEDDSEDNEADTEVQVEAATLQIHSRAPSSAKSSKSSHSEEGSNAVHVLSQPLEEEFEGETVTASLKSGKSGSYQITTTQERKKKKKKKLVESSDEDTPPEDTIDRIKRENWKREVLSLKKQQKTCDGNPGDEIPLGAIGGTKTKKKKADGSIRCVCPRCMNKSVDGAHWAPLNRFGEPLVSEADAKPGLKITKSGYCVCAKCLEAAGLVQEEVEGVPDDTSVV